MLIKVKILSVKEIEIDISPNDSVEQMEERVEQKEGIAHKHLSSVENK